MDSAWKWRGSTSKRMRKNTLSGGTSMYDELKSSLKRRIPEVWFLIATGVLFFVIVLLFVLLLTACEKQTTVSKTIPAPVSALRFAVLLHPAIMLPMDSNPQPPPRRYEVTLAWNCVPRVDADSFVTGLEASTNLVTWQEVAVLPYTPQTIVTLTNRPPYEFYRAFNRFK